MRARTSGFATCWYPVKTFGSAPMSQAPWTLFCPRSGLSPPPRMPMLPHSIVRFASDLTLSVPQTCWVIPIV